MHASLKVSLFQFVYATEVRRPSDVADDVLRRGGNKGSDPLEMLTVPSVEERVDKLAKMRERLAQNLVDAVAY